MKTITRKEWTDALRSGKYKQGSYSLVKEYQGQEHFCCLGVACEISGLPRNDKNTWTSAVEGYLPAEIAKMLQLDGGQQNTLALLNDGTDGVTFERIADFIDSELDPSLLDADQQAAIKDD